jgi:hypothetical protein
MRSNSRRGDIRAKVAVIYFSVNWLFRQDTQDFCTRFELGVYLGTDWVASMFWGDLFHCYTIEKHILESFKMNRIAVFIRRLNLLKFWSENTEEATCKT